MTDASVPGKPAGIVLVVDDNALNRTLLATSLPRLSRCFASGASKRTSCS